MVERKRHAVLHVVDDEGRALGTFACTATLPFLQETADLLARAREAGLALVVLRLLEHQVDDATATIHATYLAEALAPPPPGSLGPPPDSLPLDDHPLRARYARLGELRRDVAWADEQLARLTWRRSGHPEQQRTWNLSSVCRLPLHGGGAAWLKVVPSFFAHEGAMIQAITALEDQHGVRSRLRLPGLLAHDEQHGRVLLASCPGALMWGTGYEDWLPVVAAHVDRQAFFVHHVDELLAAGAIDRRAPAFIDAARTLCTRDDVRATLPVETSVALDALIDALPHLLDELQGCRLPDTLIHGDLTPGNVIGGPGEAFLLDWGEVSVGLPLLDLPALCRGLCPSDTQRLRATVVDLWSARCPNADVQRALALAPPLLELAAALVYQRFLDNIEPLERHFHCDDVAPRLTAAVESLQTLSLADVAR